MTTKPKLSLDEVADILAMKPVTIKRYVREGLLDSMDEGGQLLFDPDVVSRFKELQAKLR